MFNHLRYSCYIHHRDDNTDSKDCGRISHKLIYAQCLAYSRHFVNICWTKESAAWPAGQGSSRWSSKIKRDQPGQWFWALGWIGLTWRAGRGRLLGPLPEAPVQWLCPGPRRLDFRPAVFGEAAADSRPPGLGSWPLFSS